MTTPLRRTLAIFTGTILLIILLVNAAQASSPFAVTVDGTLDPAEGYVQLAVQDTATGFGDNSDATPTSANGSELDGAYLKADGTNLYIMLTGNLETNFNKLDIFLDVAAGGQNVLRDDNPDVDFNGLNAMAGLKFDASFESDYYLVITNGNDPVETYANFAETNTAGGGNGAFIGGGPGSTVVTGEPYNIEIAIDNSNTAGVSATDVNDPSAVTTGIEIKIPLATLGVSRLSTAKMVAFINSSNHDFISNQVMGPLGGIENPGAPAGVDFSMIAGDQFVQFSTTSIEMSEISAETNTALPLIMFVVLLGWASAITIYRRSS